MFHSEIMWEISSQAKQIAQKDATLKTKLCSFTSV